MTVDERIAERRREVRDERRRARLRRTLTVLAIVALLGVGYAVERSSLVALSEIQVSGTDRLDPDAVIEAAALELGTSTLRLDLGDAERRVRDLPVVAEVEARRVDPLTVRITVVERQPVLVAVSGGDRVLVDADGVVVARGGEDGLVAVLLPERAALPGPGERVSALPALAAAHTVHAQLPPTLRTRVARIEAHSADEVDVRLRMPTGEPVLVHLGRAERLDEKVRALVAVLGDVGDVAVSSIDVRAPATPVVRS
ncbi:MAG: FtsQ-type POTRA domain-containing protein [Actinobacteria bacterium]|nr:FtsQ-type POTRA domain-containing protein [Actinomycetota bacterium]